MLGSSPRGPGHRLKKRDPRTSMNRSGICPQSRSGADIAIGSFVQDHQERFSRRGLIHDSVTYAVDPIGVLIAQRKLSYRASGCNSWWKLATRRSRAMSRTVDRKLASRPHVCMGPPTDARHAHRHNGQADAHSGCGIDANRAHSNAMPPPTIKRETWANYVRSGALRATKGRSRTRATTSTWTQGV